ARKKDGVHSDVGPPADAHRLDHEVGLDDRHVDRIAGVFAAQDLRARTPADVLADLQVAAIEVALRADPGVRTDRAAAVVPTLQERLIAEEDGVADLERMRVQDQHTEADPHAIAERFAEGSHEHAALPSAIGAIDERRGGVALDEPLARFALPKTRGFRDLLGRILRDLLNAVDRFDDARAQLPFMNER